MLNNQTVIVPLADARVARSARSLKIGTLRPAIVLYDEPHPLGDDIGTIQTADIGRKPDMLIIMGTSLKVHGLKKLVKEFAKTVHASATSGGKPSSPKNTNSKSAKSWTGKVIFVNRTPPPAGEWSDIIDYHIAGETDVWVDKVVEDWKKMRPADWEIQKTLDGADGEDSPFKVVKGIPVAKAKGTSYTFSLDLYQRVFLLFQPARKNQTWTRRTCHPPNLPQNQLQSQIKPLPPRQANAVK